jgi:hypothetical protein
MTTITVARRFRGPNRSGNGGYTAGLLAGCLEADPVTVTLRTPPPLDVPLSVVPDGDGVALTDGDTLIATAVPGSLTRPAAEPVSYPEAVAASRGYPGFAQHPFPSCFTCGPDNPDGLHLYAGPVPGRDAVVAAPWTPNGAVSRELVWAALDCPGGWSIDLIGRPMVLGRITAAVSALPAEGERCVVVGHAHSVDGRKGLTDSALYTADGRLLARAEHTWVAVDPAVINALKR